MNDEPVFSGKVVESFQEVGIIHHSAFIIVFWETHAEFSGDWDCKGGKFSALTGVVTIIGETDDGLRAGGCWGGRRITLR